MKRSEMLKLMMESYAKDVPYHEDGGVQMAWKISRLLDDMEKAGMIPPNMYACTNEFRFEWEEEDEE
jgi:hypothetical protein